MIPEKRGMMTSAEPQDTKKTLRYFFSQPHQPFFLAGIVWAVAAMLFFTLSYKGVLAPEIPLAFFHAYTMLFIVFTPFLTGFIFTTFPRFCQSDVIGEKVYRQIFLLSQAGSVLFVAGAAGAPPLLAAGMLLLFLSHFRIVSRLQHIFETGMVSRFSSDPFWILTGFYFGLLAHLLFLVEGLTALAGSGTGLFPAAATSGLWMYLVFTVFSVGQRMVPFFSHVMTEKIPYFTATVFGGLLLKTAFALGGLLLMETAVTLLLALYLGREMLRWNLPTFRSPAILWVLHLALYWLPVSLLLGAFAGLGTLFGGFGGGFFELHLAAVGFVTTMLIGFGTRVALGHSGQPPHADRFMIRLFWLVQAVAVLRALYALVFSAGWSAFWLFDAAAAAWMLLFFLWGWRFAPVLLWGKKLQQG